MRIGFTGSRHMSDHLATRIDKALEEIFESKSLITEVVTGGAHGLDTLAVKRTTQLLPRARQVLFYPRGQRWNTWLLMDFNFDEATSVYATKRGHAYRSRNIEIVNRSDRLLAFPDRREDLSPRSGTWMTVRIARDKGVPITVVPLWQKIFVWYEDAG